MAEAKKKPGRPPGSKNKSSTKAKKTMGSSRSGSKSSKSTSSGSKSAKEAAYLEKVAENRLRDEIWSIVIIAVGIFLAISLQTQAAGKVGVIIHNLFLGLFGWVAFLLPYYMVLYGVLMFTKKMAHINFRSISFFLIIFFCVTLLNSAQFLDGQNFTFGSEYIKNMYELGQVEKSGGAFGMAIGLLLFKAIGIMGLYIFAICLIIISVLMITKTPLSHHLEELKIKREIQMEREEQEKADAAEYAAKRAAERKTEIMEKHFEPEPEYREPARKKSGSKFLEIDTPNYIPVSSGLSEGQAKILDYMNDDTLFDNGTQNGNHLGTEHTIVEAPKIEPAVEPVEPIIQPEEQTLGSVIDIAEPVVTVVEKVSKPDKPKVEQLDIAEEVKEGATPLKQYKLPPIDLLTPAPVDNKKEKGETLQEKAAKLEQTLKDFNVNAKVVQVTKGPAVTRYEIQPNTGVKVNSIVRLADDIALNLEAKSIRIEAPIPGKAAVGIEVENESVNMVTLREIIDSKNFNDSESKITFSVGKDISGNSIVADLKSMPHMLIAGSTGSGKSVCINSIIISMLYKSRPEEVKFVLIDPKVVELGNYNGIPHLLIPVVTEPSKAAAALNWAVAEMTDRYKKFAEEGVRDLASFNASAKKKKEDDRVLPQIVIIIDELADLMMAAPSQVEESICRLAQMARAAGMHLIVATQRPSVDVITGVIKANIPSRIAFAVSSQFDSRTILDMGGAEKLVGKGDMLFNPLGMGKPIRVQGTFISDKEVNSVIEHVKSQVEGEAEYSHDVIHTIEKVQSNVPDDDGDELLSDAIEAVVKSKQASVSGLQRRFRIGYNRAARLVDMMEQRGIIGPADGSRPRQVFMTEEELYGMDESLKEDKEAITEEVEE